MHELITPLINLWLAYGTFVSCTSYDPLKFPVGAAFFWVSQQKFSPETLLPDGQWMNNIIRAEDMSCM